MPWTRLRGPRLGTANGGRVGGSRRRPRPRRIRRLWLMRSLAHQSVQELGGPLSVLARQKADHVRLDRLLDELPGSDGETQQELLNRICRLVFSHAFAEEAVLWPAVRRVLPDGE